MKIGAVSNIPFSSAGNVGKEASSLSNSHLSPVEKQKQQIQQQIKGIEEGNLSKESKDKAIGELEKKLQELEKQLLEEKFTKLSEKTETEKTKEKDTEQQKLEEENCENPQAINKEVVLGLVSASAHEKIGKVAYSVYRVAKAKGDEEKAHRALKYNMSEIKKASNSGRLIQRGIMEYKKQLANMKKANDEVNIKTTEEVQNDDSSKMITNVEAKTETSNKEIVTKDGAGFNEKA